MVFMPHWPIPMVKNNIMLGLDRVVDLLSRLSNPHHKLPPVIHVAGTNGKGSTIAYLKAIFEDMGLKVHTYISPHLIRFNERIVLAGNEITDNFLYEIMEETRLASIGLHTTFFEATTAAAFLAFSKVRADVLLLEVGMGGRMDATNVIDNPLLSIITPISFDHVEFLGQTLAKIANEKAGIIKPNKPAIISWQMQEAMNVFINKSIIENSETYACGINWNFEVNEAVGFIFHDYATNQKTHFPNPSLFGLHQIVNAANVVAACRKLNKYFPIKDDNIINGLKNATWPARMQKIKSGRLFDMLPQGFELWLDGAHNTGGAQMIAATIGNLWQDKPLYIINGRTGERDIKGFLEYFKDIATLVCGIKVLSEPKGETAENIANAANELGFESYACGSIEDAISLIITKSQTGRILVVGSLYLAGDILLANK